MKREEGFKKHLYVEGKEKYLKGERPDVDCILCGIRDRDEKVRSLELFRNDYFIIVLNLYPYNSGHLMIFPVKHRENINEMTQKEWLNLKKLIEKSLEILGEEYGTNSFNVGWNLGPHAGGAISHIHVHVVPRFKNEVGFMELISDTKMILEKPKKTVKRLKPLFDKITI